MSQNAAIDTTLDLWDQTLGSDNKFTFSLQGTVLGLTPRTINVQILDTAKRPLISIATLPGNSGHSNGTATPSVIQMTNTSGQVLLTATQYSQTIRVCVGENILGVVEGNFNSITLTIRGITGEILFESTGGTEMNPSSSESCCVCFCCRGSGPSEFTFISNGVTLARLESSSVGCFMSLYNSQNVDMRTKALLMFTGYYIYYLFFSETVYANVAVSQIDKRITLRVCICFMMLVFACTMIPIVFLNMRSK